MLTLTRLWIGEIRYGDARADESIQARGPTRLRRAFPGWLGLSLFADVKLPSG